MRKLYAPKETTAAANQRQTPLLNSKRHQHSTPELTHPLLTTASTARGDEEDEWCFSSTQEHRVDDDFDDDDDALGKNGFTNRDPENHYSTKKKKTDSFFWCSSMRLYCRVFLYFGAMASVTFLLYATLSRDTAAFSIVDGDKDGIRHNEENEHENKEDDVKRPKVKLEIFMESQCPDTTRFIDSQLVPVFQELKEYLDLSLIPFGKAKWTKSSTKQDDYSFQCQHGPRECLVNQLMCCGIERLKSVNKYLPYLACLQGTSPGGREQEKCASVADLSPAEMQECANGTEGRSVHRRMGELTKQLRPTAFFIPWILVDGKREKRALTELKILICEKLASNFQAKPKPCTLALLSSSSSSTSTTITFRLIKAT